MSAKLRSLADAAALIPAGAIVAFGGSLLHRTPAAELAARADIDAERMRDLEWKCPDRYDASRRARPPSPALRSSALASAVNSVMPSRVTPQA